MALVSPGLEITVTDESQYLSTAVGTVPFVLVATAQDKVFNGSVAPYTTKANAGKLLAVTSQRDLVTNFGTPTFQLSSAGTPLNGHELNEYGLMAAYSSLGVCNRMYMIRADIDLAQLQGTTVRPFGEPANGTYWLDLTNTVWGIYEWNADTQAFVNKVPLILTSSASTTNIGGILTPVASIGQIGSYAVVASSVYNYLFYKRNDNVWVQVGSTGWQNAWAAVTGTVANPTITTGSDFVLNTSNVSVSGTSASSVVSAVNSASIPGVTAGVVFGKVVFYVTSEAASDGSTVDGLLSVTDGTFTPMAAAGITPGVYASPSLAYGGYVQVPDWRETDSVPRPTGSIWAKTSVLGSGANLSFNIFNESTASWVPVSAPIYADDSTAIYGLDPNAGGFGIGYGTLYVKQDALNNETMTYRPFIRQTQGSMVITGTVPTTPPVFNVSDSFTLETTVTGSSGFTSYTVTLAGTDTAAFVSAILSANIPEVTATIESSGAVSITQIQGGTILFTNVVGTPLTTAGFTSSTSGIQLVPGSTSLMASNFQPLTYTYSLSHPYTAPTDGTLWFNNDPLDVDILVNETTGWKGYRNVSNDARGYNLVNTDPAGPILSPTAPTTQSDNTVLVAGDLWIDTGDLVNYPVISRWNGTAWVLIDNSDTVSQNGIVFADARWDIDGTTDPSVDALVPISDMLTSNYTDLDCPDHRLYPRGTLLFNLRRSGFNIKHYVGDYFSATSFPDDSLPTESATWVTSSGLKENGSPYMGSSAQRAMVTKALLAAISANDTVREDSFAFNLIVCPGYPELIPDLVELNNDRKNTAFIIGDTPMTLAPNIVDLTNWSTDVDGTGLGTADPYMAVYYPSGQTNDLAGNTIVVPPSHMALRCAIRSDNISYPWFAFAGTRRGLIDNASDIGYIDAQSGAFVHNGINQGIRDALYPMNINPLTLLPDVGLVNFGNKTRSGVSSALDRVNVARLVNYIRTILAHSGDGFLFEPNDTITRNQFKQLIESALNDLIAKRGIYDYLVICDETNNTNDRIARNELYCDIAIEPMKDVEFIYIPIRLLNPGAIALS